MVNQGFDTCHFSTSGFIACNSYQRSKLILACLDTSTTKFSFPDASGQSEILFKKSEPKRPISSFSRSHTCLSYTKPSIMAPNAVLSTLVCGSSTNQEGLVRRGPGRTRMAGPGRHGGRCRWTKTRPTGEKTVWRRVWTEWQYRP